MSVVLVLALAIASFIGFAGSANAQTPRPVYARRQHVRQLDRSREIVTGRSVAAPYDADQDWKRHWGF